MRLAVLSRELPDRAVGGLGRHLRDLVAALRGAGDEVEVLEVAEPAAGLASWVDPGRDPSAARLLARHREAPFDLIHAHDWHGALAAAALEAVGVPLVWTCHLPAGSAFRYEGQQDGALGAALEHLMLRRARRVIAVSRFTASELERVYRVGGEKVTVVHNGVDPQVFRAQARRDSQTVLLVGRLVPQKGTDDWPEILRQVQILEPKARFEIVGDGPEVERLQARLSRDLVAPAGEAAVRWTPFLTRPSELAERYAAARVLAFPSVYEPFGLVVLEALACGLPVVAYDAGGPREILTDGVEGLLVPAGDRQAFARAVASLLADPGRAEELGRRGRETVLARFTAGRCAAETQRVYQEVLDRPGERSRHARDGSPVHLSMVLHAYQPPSIPDDEVLARVETTYLPVLEVHQRLGFPLTLNLQGCLLERLESLHPGVIERLLELLGEGLLEVTASAHYHPLLPLVSRASRQQQIARNLQVVESLLGVRPRGFWPPELTWSPALGGELVRRGFDWVLVDGGSLLEAWAAPGAEPAVAVPRELAGAYRLGEGLAAVPRHHLLSNRLFHRGALLGDGDLEPFLGDWHRLVEGGLGPWVTLAGDAETVDLASTGRYERLLAEMARSSRPTTVSEALERFPAADRLDPGGGSWLGAMEEIWLRGAEEWAYLQHLEQAWARLARSQVPPEARLEVAELLHRAEASCHLFWRGPRSFREEGYRVMEEAERRLDREEDAVP